MAELEKVRELVERTLEQTERGKLDWKRTADEDVFLVVINNGKHLLKSFGHTIYATEEGSGPPSLGLYSKESDMLLDVTFHQVQAAKLGRIHALAKDKATGIAEALDEVLSSLTDDDDLPF